MNPSQKDAFLKEMREVSEGIPLNKALPSSFPLHWKMIQRWGDGYAVESISGLRVIATGMDNEFSGDLREWLHISLTRKNQVPDYKDLCEVKEIFAGKDRWAYQVLAPASAHINIHPYCLHLWVLVSGKAPIPDFGKYGTI